MNFKSYYIYYCRFIEILEVSACYSLQIAFEGDSLKLICKVSGLGKYESIHDIVAWTWEGQNPTVVFDNTVQLSLVNDKDNETVQRYAVLLISKYSFIYFLSFD